MSTGFQLLVTLLIIGGVIGFIIVMVADFRYAINQNIVKFGSLASIITGFILIIIKYW